MPRKPTCTCGECRKCKHREYMWAWYQAKSPEERRAWVAKRDPDAARVADRKRYRRDREKRRKAADAYRRSHPEVVARIGQAWSKRNPEKRRAHSAVARAIRSGRLVRGCCEVCGATERIQAHHDDYSKPLEVRWLCPAHHAAERRTDP